MRVQAIRGSVIGVFALAAVLFAACDDEVDLFVPHADAGARDATAPIDAGADADADDATPAPTPARLLVTGVDFVGARSELLALNLESHAVDGRIVLPSSATTVVASGGALFVVARDTATVTRLEPGAPWQARATFPLADGVVRTAYAARADVVVAGAKAYVLFADRNALSVVDLTAEHDGEGGAAASIDLTRLVQPGDSDGVVDVVAGVYVAARRLVYLVLGNVDTRGRNDGRIACGGTKSTVVALDVDTDSLVDLNGDGAGLALDLAGVNPSAVAYDAPRDRLLVAHDGCVARDASPPVDAGADADAGSLWSGREIEELSLFTNASRRLLDTTVLGTPTRFVLVDEHRALIQLTSDDGARTTYVWDPATPALGRSLAAPDAFSFDGAGRLLGVERQFAHDGGADTYDAVTVRIADARKSTLATLPFALVEPFVASTTLLAP